MQVTEVSERGQTELQRVEVNGEQTVELGLPENGFIVETDYDMEIWGMAVRAGQLIKFSDLDAWVSVPVRGNGTVVFTW
jgi:hypothetical protein